MKDLSQIREELNKIVTYDDFFKLRQLISHFPDEDLFGALFPIAIDGREDMAPLMAGCALIELQPDCPIDLGQLLPRVHESKLFLSFREVPFYLISQFGKHNVLAATRLFLDTVPSEPYSRVASIAYWASMPASDLCKHFHEWEAEETYGRSDA